jgi:hypothetical protein
MLYPVLVLFLIERNSPAVFSDSTGEPSVDDLVGWSTFLAFWSKHYRHLIIRRPNADICPDCYIAANVLKFGTREKQNADDLLADLSDLDPPEEADDDDDDEDAFPGRQLFSLDERERIRSSRQANTLS